jgi:hypothetical protein
MIPHIVIFHKQFDLSLANHTESPVLSASFSPLRTGLRAVFSHGFPLDFLPYLRYTMMLLISAVRFWRRLSLLHPIQGGFL